MNPELSQKFGNRIRVRVCGLLFDDERLLLVRHSGIGQENILWIPPGGGVDFGERLEDALIREFEEETGMRISVDRLLTMHEYIEPPLHAIEFFFLVTANPHQIPAKGTDPELKEKQIIQEVKYVTFKELAVMPGRFKHQILRKIDSAGALLNLERHFKF
ncbi:NUDIX domain-containing protein [Fulvivirga sedimenti]|uniref:NUDIX hydrolase n=1 Tax=Fulvivirga sedimenti TaxID=2879465 RepID=A0A9X1KYR4_9BACT|nr:NUDIX hydrolase [Fulvivirga sedimenti]MCA6073891.1 NUDIX hydrolase [Fulvivirga sedimenti]